MRLARRWAGYVARRASEASSTDTRRLTRYCRSDDEGSRPVADHGAEPDEHALARREERAMAEILPGKLHKSAANLSLILAARLTQC